MPNGRLLQIFRDGKRSRDRRYVQLPAGAQGNVATLFEMATIVREDSLFPDLRNFVFRELIGVDKKTTAEKMAAAFYYCRDRIVYLQESETTETVADLWSCLYSLNNDHPAGDCAIKSVALATCLSYLNLKPYFVALQQIPGADFFNHVFVAIDSDGKEIGMDPTPEDFEIGQELGYLARMHYSIFR
jgi:transglutaminase-like putative cysteine protease